MTIDAVELTQALIRCESITPTEGGALSLMEAELKKLGFRCERKIFEEAGTEPVDNLYARFGTNGPNFCFAGHTDVVPPGNADAWKFPPFSATIENGFLYGRGTVDMKGAIAAFAAAAADFVGNPFQGSVSLLLTGDEEGVAINGTKKMLEWLKAKGEMIDACIVGEPTNPTTFGEMAKIGRRGSLTCHLDILGTQGHAAYPQFADNPMPRLVATLGALLEKPLDQGTAEFQPTSLQVVAIETGNPADNVIPGKVTARFNIRFNNLHTGESLKQWIGKICSQHAGKHEVRFHLSGEAFLTPKGRLSELVTESVNCITGKTPELSTTGGTSDARFIKDYCPVVEFGLITETAHKVNERVAIQDIESLRDIYLEMLNRFFKTS